MAIPDFVGTIMFIDKEKKVFTRTVYSGAASHGAAVTEIGTLVGTLEPLTDCVITGYSVGQYIANDSGVPAQDVDGEIQALFNFDNQDGRIRAISIPGFDRSYLIAGTDQVNTLHADVVAFVNAYTGGTIRDLNDVDIRSLVSAQEHFTKKRKGS